MLLLVLIHLALSSAFSNEMLLTEVTIVQNLCPTLANKYLPQTVCYPVLMSSFSSLYELNSRLFVCVAFTCIHVRASTSSICLCLSLRCSLLFLLPRSFGISRTCLEVLSRCNWLTAGADCCQSVAQSWTKDKPLLPVKYHFMHFIAFLRLINFWGQVGCFRKVLITIKCSKEFDDLSDVP